jgi:GNAT superfamily N-acetyltransferase
MHRDFPTPQRLDARHAPALVALVNSAYRGESGREGWTTESDLLDGIRLRLPDAEALLADPDVAILGIPDAESPADRLLACVCLEHAGPLAAYLGMLSVNPRAQRGGIGRHMIAAAEEWVRLHWTWAKAMDMTVIAVRTELVAYYARRGYLATGERRPFPGYADPERFGHPKRPDLDFVVLRKPLR